MDLVGQVFVAVLAAGLVLWWIIKHDLKDQIQG
jgi:hypothetical protein